MTDKGFQTAAVSSQPNLAVAAKILAVDDDEANLLALRAILGELGQPIVCARSGDEALRILLKDDFAIILLDVRMPGIDGYETAALIRARERNRHVPIIFLSAIDRDEAHLFRGYAAGAVDYVFKPIEPVILRAKVAIFLDLHTKTQEIQRQAEHERRLLEENLKVRAEQLETAEALRRSLAQQSLVIESLPIALFVTSSESGFRSRRFIGGKPTELLHVDEAQIAGIEQSWLDRIHEADRDMVLETFSHLNDSGTMATEYRFRCGSQDYCWFSERVSMVNAGDGGGAPEVAGVLFDITARKQMEEQLIHAQKMEAIGQMTGGIAHDFNNMLSVIIGSLNRVLSKDEVSAKVHQRLDLAMQAALSCAALTKRLLGFGRRQSLEPQLIDLQEQLKTLEPLFTRVLSKDIEVTVDCGDGLWSIYLDPSQLEAAIVNLAINARDAMPDGGRLDIVARNLSARQRRSLDVDLKAGDYVQLAVIDSGQGMSKEVMARALEPFFTTKGPGKGTGLGLSSIASFIRHSGGAIALASEIGKGTRITLYLPRATAHARPRARKDEGDGETLPAADPV